MAPLLELKIQIFSAEPGYVLGQTLPGNISQNRIMGLSRISNGDFSRIDFYRCLTLDEVPVDLLGVALFKASELLGKHAVEGVSAIMVITTSKWTFTRMAGGKKSGTVPPFNLTPKSPAPAIAYVFVLRPFLRINLRLFLSMIRHTIRPN